MLPNYPYTDFHRLNADWILEKTKEAAALVEGAETRLEALEADVASLQQGLGIVEQQVESHEDWLQNLQGRMTAAEADIDGIDHDVTEIGTRLNTAERDIDAAELDIYNIMNDVTSLKNRMTTAESDVQTLQQGLGIVEQQVESHEDWLQNLQGRMIAAESSIQTLNADIDGLDSALETVENDVADLQLLIDSISPMNIVFSGDSTSTPSTAACDKTWQQIDNWFHTQGKPIILWYRTAANTMYQLGCVAVSATGMSGSCYIPEDPFDPADAFVMVTCGLNNQNDLVCYFTEV